MSWKQVCKQYRGGAGIKDLRQRNRALLGKWVWRLGSDSGSFWNSIIKSKYGSSRGGSWTNSSTLYRASHIWKNIMRLQSKVLKGIRFQPGTGNKISFWKDLWIGDKPLKDVFPSIYRLAPNSDIMVADCFSLKEGKVEWNICCRRNLEDWEIPEFVKLLESIYNANPNPLEADKIIWRKEKSALFSVRSLYSLLLPNQVASPEKHHAPSKQGS